MLFADVRRVADAQACVAAVRVETPGSGGRLGVGRRRDVGTVRDGSSPAYVTALDEVVIAVMVEKRGCVEDLDAWLRRGSEPVWHRQDGARRGSGR